MPQILQVNYFDLVLILFFCFLELSPGVGHFGIGVWNDSPPVFGTIYIQSVVLESYFRSHETSLNYVI